MDLACFDYSADSQRKICWKIVDAGTFGRRQGYNALGTDLQEIIGIKNKYDIITPIKILFSTRERHYT